MAENGSNKGKSGKSGNNGSSGLEAIAAAARLASGKYLPPVHLWNPPHCGDIGLRIGRDGTWYYRNSPIGRMPLVRLFASVLRKDPKEFVLVTPVEKITIEVEDAPFIAVEMKRGQVETEAGARPVLAFRTNVGDWVEAGPDHEIRFETGPSEGIKPYIRVRADLWALISRPLFYDLVELGETRTIAGTEVLGVESAGAFFTIAPAADIGDSVAQD